MSGITISDRVGDQDRLAVDLADILQELGHQIAISTWEISDIECLGDEAERFYQLADTQTRISGDTLLQIAKNIAQVIDGTFVGYLDSKSEPWIIIQATDSNFYDVETRDETILKKLRECFHNVEDIPESETQLTATPLILG